MTASSGPGSAKVEEGVAGKSKPGVVVTGAALGGSGVDGGGGGMKFGAAMRVTSSLSPLQRLGILSGGVAGVVFEIVPALTAAFNDLEMRHAAEHLIDLVGDSYSSSRCGTALWVVYKRLFGQDIRAMMLGIDTKEKQASVRAWLRDPTKGGIYMSP
jgi:hypothetical protein